MRSFNPLIGVWVSVIAFAGHLYWAYAKRSGSPLSAGGAFIIAIGVMVIARSLIRLGRKKIARSGRAVLRQVREVNGQIVSATPEEDFEQNADARAELVIGPALVFFGTIVNGYGSIIGDCMFASGGCLLR